MEGDYLRRATAEFVGTFALIFVGAGAIMTAGGIHDPSLIGIAVAHGLVIGVMASAVGHISGGHFNPAVTLAFVVTRRMKLSLAGVYWVTQFGAATLGALLLKWIYPASAVDGAKLGVPALNGSISSGAGLVVEAVLTFFLVWVIFATAADPRGAFKQISGLAIGFTITLDILIGGPLTGAAMNPARAFGPQLVQNAWSDGWIWYVGPIAGGVVAGVLYELLYLHPPRPEPVGVASSGPDEPAPAEAALS